MKSLPALYGQVWIPPAVYGELDAATSDLPVALSLASEPWLTVVAAQDEARVRSLREDLDPGEAEAIVLAIESRADLLLVDERRAAMDMGLQVMGLLGVVARAKRNGLVGLAKPILDELILTASFWVGPELYREVLRALDETE